MAKSGPKGPTKYDKTFHPDDFLRLSKQGKTFAQIAKAWNIHRSTIIEWSQKHAEFSDAVRQGRELAEAWYMDLGQAAMLGTARVDKKPIQVSLGWFKWMTQNMFKWSINVDTNAIIEVPKDDRPLKHLSNEELDALEFKK
jgi:hypothetical protein